MASLQNPNGSARATQKAPRPGSITFGLIGFLFLLELTSGILQGYYIPLIPTLIKHLHIETAEYNWFEAAQLLLSAIVVPFLAKLGDMFGHKRILLISKKYPDAACTSALVAAMRAPPMTSDAKTARIV